MYEKSIIAMFTYHAPSPSQAVKIKRLRERFLSLALDINDLEMDQCHKETAIGNLHVVSMMCNAGIVLTQPSPPETEETRGLNAVEAGETYGMKSQAIRKDRL